MTIVYDKSPVAVRAEPLSEVWWQGRQWAVTAYGIERRDGAYVIEARRLAKDLRSSRPYSWIVHLGDTKDWVDLEDFATAFFVACAVHRVRLRKGRCRPVAPVILLSARKPTARRKMRSS